MTYVIWILAILLVLALAAGAAVRLAPSDPAVWHVDPMTEGAAETTGAFLVRPTDGDLQSPRFERTPQALMTGIDRIALAEPRTERLAGSVEAGHATYVARSKIWGFPDYISVRALPDGDGARLAILSRLRFGQDDMGVNQARVRRWLSALQP